MTTFQEARAFLLEHRSDYDKAVAGFRWPDQQPDAVDALVDNDGIVCLPPVSGEQGAAERLRAVALPHVAHGRGNGRGQCCAPGHESRTYQVRSPPAG